MTNKRSTKRQLLAAVLALVMCVSMFVGSTFAWFTDSVVTGNNKIIAGNLDVELEYSNTPDGEYTSVAGVGDIFVAPTGETKGLWEPGHTEVAYLKVRNAGTLALKYNLSVSPFAETVGYNAENKEIRLSEILKFAATDPTENAPAAYTRESAQAAASASAQKLYEYTTSNLTLLPGEEKYVTLVVYMPEEVGNEANYRGEDIPTIEFAITLLATQETYENDSFDDQYDKNATWIGGTNYDWYLENPDAKEFIIDTPEELAGLAEIVNGTAQAASTFAMRAATTTIQDSFEKQTIKLGANIDLNNLKWNPIGAKFNSFAFKGTFDGQNHTITNLFVDAEDGQPAGFIGVQTGGSVKNVKFTNAKVMGTYSAGVVVGQTYCAVRNCSVVNSEVVSTPAKVSANGYRDGNNVGLIAGYAENSVITGCTVEKSNVFGFRCVGGIVGTATGSARVNGNTLTVVEVGYTVLPLGAVDVEGKVNSNIGKLAGRAVGSSIAKEEDNTIDETVALSESVVVDEGDYKLEYTYDENGNKEDVVLYVVDSEVTEKEFVIPEGVTAVGGYSFAYNTNIETIVLPTTVTSLEDRAFRDTSASTVVLNEGLEAISYQAFRNALNVKNVTIPSTVTSIAKEAFQNSGIESLVVPANVTTLEYGALRDMKNVETIIIEGDVEIPDYAARGCTNLKTVILTGENVTFSGKNMKFCNYESGKAENITVYVANETVAERYKAAEGAIGYTLVVSGGEAADGYLKTGNAAYSVYSAEGLAAINDAMIAGTLGKNVVIDIIADIDFTGREWKTVDSHADSKFYFNEIDGNGHTIKNLTVNGQAMFRRFAGFGDVVIKDLTFDGAKITSNAINTSILTVQSYQNVLLDNVDVINSTIKGGYKVAPLIATVYNESSSTVTATLKNCDVSKTTVIATAYDFCTTGMVSFVNAGDNDKIEFENCTITDVQINVVNDSYKAHAAVYTEGSGSLYNEAEGVTVTNVTFGNI